ncbi:hypothetical protein FB464_3842 [Subtercola boreus]|nr:hypothetical protein FB464_3842 [Subtercola boreus]
MRRELKKEKQRGRLRAAMDLGIGTASYARQTIV